MATLIGTPKTLPKSHIEAAQSVPARKPSDRTQPRRVVVTDSEGPAGILGGCLHVILYYKKASSEDSGWVVTGWMKESLGRALEEQPHFAGRIRRRGSSEGEKEVVLEIVSNDGGVRLFEAIMPRTLEEFLDDDLKKWKDAAESELVFWEGIDDQNPHFFPLFYVQVTNFRCGGYSIGISCSILVSDPLAVISFLRKWANIHNNIISGSDSTKLPIFYFPKLRPNGDSSSQSSTPPLFCSDQIKDRARTMIFRSTTGIKNSNNSNPDHEMHDAALALQCVEKAEKRLGVKRGNSKFSLLVKEKLSEDIKVESFARGSETHKESNLRASSWDDLGVGEVAFCEGNKPAHVSCWISSGEGLAVLIPATDDDDDESVSKMNIVVTIPNETQVSAAN